MAFFNRFWFDLPSENRSKIDEKLPSKMECLNLRPFCYENQAQDAPKTPQDARGGPKRRFKDPRDTPRTPQDAPRTLPKISQDLPKTPQNAPRTPLDATKTARLAPRTAQDSSRFRFWIIFGDEFQPFLDDFFGILDALLYRFLN